MAKRPDPVAYARACKPLPGGRTAWIDKHPEALKVIAAWVKEWKAGSQMTWPQAHRYLKTYLGYPLSHSAFRHWVETKYGNVK